MDVVEILRRASEVVERSGVAADLRGVAFSTAVDMLLKDPGASGRGDLDRSTGPVADPDPAPVERPARQRPSAHRTATWNDAAWSEASWSDPAWSDDDGADGGRGADDEAPTASVSRLGPVTAHRSASGARSFARDRSEESGASYGGPVSPGRAQRSDRLVAVGPTRGPAAVPDDPWGHIADALGVRPELLDRVWEERGGRLQLAGDPARFGRTRAQRVGTAAVLLLAALRWSGRDAGEPVPDAVVRAEVERLGLLDTGNYTKHLAGRRQVLSMTGSGRTATYKLRYDGLEEARAIAQALLEEG